jgi:hypothetical protein
MLVKSIPKEQIETNDFVSLIHVNHANSMHKGYCGVSVMEWISVREKDPCRSAGNSGV